MQAFRSSIQSVVVSVLITEMVGSLLHLMPLAVVAFVALLIDQLLGGHPIYGQLAAAMEKPNQDQELSGQEDQLMLPVYENSQLADKTISEIAWPDNTLVKTIQRDNEMIIPDGQTRIVPGDILILEVDASQRGKVYNAMKKIQGVELDG